MPNPFRAARYHSLIVDEETLRDELQVTARTDDGVPMAIEHRAHRTYGVQFHPESVLTEAGHRLLGNFLALAGIETAAQPAGDYVDLPAADDWQSGPRLTAGPLHW